MDFKELRQKSGMNLKQFSEYFNIPYRTIQHWEAGDRKCPDYVLELIEYKLQNEGFFYETIHVKIPQNFGGYLIKEVEKELKRKRRPISET